MKVALVLAAALAVVLPAAASAQSLGEEGSWQFRTPAERSVALSTAQTIEAKQGGAYEANGGFGGFAGGGGGPAANAANTNNYFQYIDQSQTTNNCSSSGGVGSPISCGGSSSAISGLTQNSSGNSNQATPTISGNTFTTQNNTNNTQNRGDGQTVTTNNAPPQMMVAPGTPIGGR